jgi:hypothetical protein
MIAVPIAILVVVLVFLVYGLGKTEGELAMELEAIKAGVAEYRLDENFERQFHWKTNKP